jgi:two-component sensor histidine kinase
MRIVRVARRYYMNATVQTIDFLKGGGEMGALTRSHDWGRTALGPPETWPESLRTTVRLILNSRQPMFVWWGPDLLQFYNDAYSATMGPERHPSALGALGQECWAEIWDIIGPQIEYVMAGKGSTWDEDRLVPVTRNGGREDVWWTYGYSPIEDAEGIRGVLVVCKDVTSEHLAKQALKQQTERLEQLFEQAPGFIAVLSGPDHVFELTNAAYRDMVGNRDFLNRPVREVFPDLDGQGFFELLDSVYKTRTPHIGRRVPISFQSGDSPARTAFLDFVYQPIMDAVGTVSGIFVQGTDVTDLHEAEVALRNKDLQLTLALDAANIGVWECTVEDGRFVNLQEDERAARMLNRDLDTEPDFEAFSSRVHPDDRLALHESARAALAPDGDGILDVEYRMLALPDAPEHWIHARAQAVKVDGVTKFVGTVRDVSDIKDGEARQEMVRGELQHRIKNLLAMVSAISVQTLRGDDIADRREAFNARLHVLAQAQDMLMLGATESAGIHDTIRRALAPHDGAVSRFGIEGPEFLMNPKQTLSMALSVHELATNAMKYGALSNEHGRVRISWTLEEAGDGSSRLFFTWREEGGPAVNDPASKGFGSRLISRVLAADFNGEVRINYPPRGVVCELTARIRT